MSMSSPDKPPTKPIGMMLLTLGLLTFQVTGSFLVQRYSRYVDFTTTHLSARFRSGILGENWIQSVVICLCEIIKFCFSTTLVYMEQQAKGGDFGSHYLNVLKNSYHLLPPALMYFIQNFLVIYSLQNLKAAVFSVLNQLKTFTTAIFTVLILKRHISARRWVALVVLVLGVVCVKLQKQGDDGTENNNFYGVVGALAITILSGLSGVYIELFVKKKTQGFTIWDRNVQLALWSIGFASATSVITDYDRIFSEGPFTEFTTWAMAVMMLQAAGGILVALIIKYGNNVVKGFAVSMAIILASLFSAIFWDLQLSLIFGVGVALVVASIFGYIEFTPPKPSPVPDIEVSDEEIVADSDDCAV